MDQFNKLHRYSWEGVSIAPLVIFRILFGALMCYSTIRFASNGWIETCYITPKFFFPFFDLQWLKPLPGNGMYVVFVLLGISSLFICLGLFYRISASVFFLLFTYTELLDKSYYLNHYYLVCLLSFWMVVTSGHRYFSLDTFIFPKIKKTTIPRWQIGIFKIQLSIVYFFAGLGKVNSDWLFHAEPMWTWLPGKYQLPLLGKIVGYKTTAYLFSWMGCIYDLTIWIFLLWKPTRKLAYVGVVVFHVLTSILFTQIGMFPYIMITTTVIFFSTQWHEKVLAIIQNLKSKIKKVVTGSDETSVLVTQDATFKIQGHKLKTVLLSLYVLVQIFLPFRHLYYPGNLFWHEQGFRFSWRVMLIEKGGLTDVIVRDPKTGFQTDVEQCDYLTRFQERMMSTQPDMILQFVHAVGDEFKKEKGYAPEIYVKSILSLNGHRRREFVNDTIDLYPLTDSYKNRNWVLPFKNDVTQ